MSRKNYWTEVDLIFEVIKRLKAMRARREHRYTF